MPPRTITSRGHPHDAIGNPLHDGTWAYTWQYGRQLEKMECGSGETAMFAYNKDGLRIRKESSSRGITRYVLSGKQIIHMTRKKAGALEAEMHFYYNERSKPTVCAYNGKRYGYVYNAHGDVMALIDLENGRHQVVTYTYDAWGRQIGCTGDLAGTLGKENPFRYRTYVYDEETGLYYLRSRYYNPEWGRFINADKLLTQNLFAYCENMPVKMVDADGMSQVHVTHSLDGGGVAKKDNNKPADGQGMGQKNGGKSSGAVIVDEPPLSSGDITFIDTYDNSMAVGVTYAFDNSYERVTFSLSKSVPRNENFYTNPSDLYHYRVNAPANANGKVHAREFPIDDPNIKITQSILDGAAVQVIALTDNGYYWINEVIPEGESHRVGRYSGFIKATPYNEPLQFLYCNTKKKSTIKCPTKQARGT